jgi:Cu-Zn family superoxide dismutase
MVRLLTRKLEEEIMRMRTLTALAALLTAASITPALPQDSAAGAGQDQPRAAAKVIGKDGQQVGSADLRETPHGVLIRLTLEGLPPGEKAVHIHENGECDAAGGFQSAGGHFNPSGANHGYLDADGPHAGDLPSQWVEENGVLEATVFAPMAALAAGEDANPGEGRHVVAGGTKKTAIVVHEKADDYASQPSGEAGARIACGVIELASPT